jgi:cysteine-rich repeat protein
MPPPRVRPLALALLLLAAIARADAAAARHIEVPTFVVGPNAEVSGLQVAVGTDGAMVFAWHADAVVSTQRYSQAGAPLAAPIAVAAGSDVRIAADTRGGYVLAYLREADGRRRLFGRRLDADGAAVGPEIAVDQAAPDDVALPEVLGLATGFAFVWQQGSQCWIRRYDPDGVVLADAAVVGDNGWNFPLAAAVLDDGGIVVLWHDPSIHTFLGRTLEADGTSRFGPTFLPTNFEVTAVVPTTGGGFAAVGVASLSTVRVMTFGPSLNALVARDVAVLPTTDRPVAALGRDVAGRALVTIATSHRDTPQSEPEHGAPRAHPLATNLTALEPSFTLDAASTATHVATALLPSGSFVTAWSTAGPPGAARGRADVVSLCTPDIHVCGDGTLDPRCEACDDGAGNSDTDPDACRTTCALPSCGDGTTDAGETCDDGDPSPCDGCGALCQPVAGLGCGDGILVPGCGDQCDDGNAVVGDGCAPACTFERIAGGGSRATDCLAEWIVANPTNVPLVDGRGRFRRTQRCRDDDPACDFDGGVPGRCTFRVRVCAGNTDLAGCTPSALASWTLTKPSLTQAVLRPELAAVRSAFDPVPGAVTGVSLADTCAAPVEVVVPLRGTSPRWSAGKLALAAAATAVGGVRDQDGLKLVCSPALF